MYKARIPQARGNSTIWILICLGLVMCLVVYVALSSTRSGRLAVLLASEANSAHNLVAHDLKVRIDAVERLAIRWKNLPAPNAQEFEADGGRLLADLPGFFAVSYLDRLARITRVEPPHLNALIGRDFESLGPERRQMFRAMRSRLTSVVSQPLSLKDGSGKGFLILAPIVSERTLLGGVLVVFNVETWVQNLYFGLGDDVFSDVNVELWLGDDLIFQSEGYTDTTSRSEVVVEGKTVLGRSLRLIARPDASLLAETASVLPELVAVLMALIVLGAGALYLALQHARAATKSLLASNDSLVIANDNLIDQIGQRRAAQLAAHHASEAKSEFLRSVSHEIRTPMNGVLGVSALLKQSELTDKQRTMVETIMSSGQALLEVINNVLDFSKIETTGAGIRTAPFNLRDVVATVVRTLGADCPPETVEIAVIYAPDTPRWILGDEDRVRQMLNNLVGNAIKFTPKGYIRVTVEISATIVRISVVDSGIGVPAEKFDRIFEEFRQVDGEENRSYGGAGLGLAISRRIAREMGGDIIVKSEYGKGSTFVLSFPHQQVDAEQQRYEERVREKRSLKKDSSKVAITGFPPSFAKRSFAKTR